MCSKDVGSLLLDTSYAALKTFRCAINCHRLHDWYNYYSVLQVGETNLGASRPRTNIAHYSLCLHGKREAKQGWYHWNVHCNDFEASLSKDEPGAEDYLNNSFIGEYKQTGMYATMYSL